MLPDDLSVEVMVREHALAIHSLNKLAAASLLEIGQRLAAVKALIPGQFTNWLASEFGWSERWAQTAMAAAKRFGARELPAAITPSLLQELASPSVPDSVVEAALAQPDQVSTRDVRALAALARAVEAIAPSELLALHTGLKRAAGGRLTPELARAAVEVLADVARTGALTVDGEAVPAEAAPLADWQRAVVEDAYERVQRARVARQRWEICQQCGAKREVCDELQ